MDLNKNTGHEGMKKPVRILLFVFAVILFLCAAFAAAVAFALHIHVDYDDPESLGDVASKTERYLVMTHPDKDSPELQAALKELDDIALLDVSDEEKTRLIRARFPEESFWPDELKALLRSAESGDRDAQYRLGCLYLDDDSVRASAGRELMRYVVPDLAPAEKWLLKAARQGHADAQYLLAKCYEDWHPVLKSKFSFKLREFELMEAEQKQWMKTAAKNGNMYAEYSVSHSDSARRRIQEAAERGDAVALAFDKIGFPPECYLKNAENGSVFAMCKYAMLCESGIEDWVEDEATSEYEKVVIREPDREAAETWKRKAFDTAMKHLEEDGDPRDLYTFVWIFDRFSEDFLEGIADGETAAGLTDRITTALWNTDQTSEVTFFLLVSVQNLRKKRGLETEDIAAFYRKLAKHSGFFHYQLRLARILLEKETEEDKAEGVGMLRHLAGLGDPRARYFLGQCYLDGTGVPPDKAEAVKWFRKAAEQRVEHAMESLAVCLKAPGEPHDEREAERWERKKEISYNADTRLEYAWIVVRENAKYAWNYFTDSGPRSHHQ